MEKYVICVPNLTSSDISYYWGDMSTGATTTGDVDDACLFDSFAEAREHCNELNIELERLVERRCYVIAVVHFTTDHPEPPDVNTSCSCDACEHRPTHDPEH